jgi:hypothetical protein
MLLGGAVIAVGGCGGGGASSPAASSRSLSDAVGTVSSNHGHSAVITAAQLGGGGDLELDIRGTSGHTHTVSLSASEVSGIRDGLTVQKESSGSSHIHTVTFNP